MDGQRGRGKITWGKYGGMQSVAGENKKEGMKDGKERECLGFREGGLQLNWFP